MTNVTDQSGVRACDSAVFFSHSGEEKPSSWKEVITIDEIINK